MAFWPFDSSGYSGSGYPGWQRVFFLLLAAKQRRSRDRVTSGKKTSGHGSYEPHFHVILKQDSWSNRFFVGSVCFRNLTCLQVGQWCVKRVRNVVKLRNGEFREQCFDNSGEKTDVCTSSPDRGFASQTLAPRVESRLRQIELHGTVLWEHYRLLYRSFQVCTHRTGLKLPFQNSSLAQFVITPTKSPETLKKSNLVSDFIF